MIAVEVARVAGWRETHFPGVNCRDVPAPPGMTLQELLDNSLAYAQATQKRLLAEFAEEL